MSTGGWDLPEWSPSSDSHSMYITCSSGGGGGGILIDGNGPGSPGFGGGEGDFYAPGTSHPARRGVIIFEIP